MDNNWSGVTNRLARLTNKWAKKLPSKVREEVADVSLVSFMYYRPTVVLLCEQAGVLALSLSMEGMCFSRQTVHLLSTAVE